MTITTLILNYLARVSFCYKYSFSMLPFFIHPEASIDVLLKRLFEFLEHPSITSISRKNSFSEHFGKTSFRTFILESFIQIHLQVF